MATFSENQVRQLYVGLSHTASKPTQASPVGTIAALADTAKTTLWFGYMGAKKNLVASDKITIKNIVSAKATSSDKMVKNLDRFKVVLVDAAMSTPVGGKNPIVGQDYILRLAFRQFVGMSDEDQYWKYGMVHATAGMTQDNFYKTLALSLVKNLSREALPLVNVYVHSKAAKSKGGFDNQGFRKVDTTMIVDYKNETETNPYWDGSSAVITDIDSIIIEQVAQDWELGTMQQGYIPFEVQPLTVVNDGDEVIWGDVTKEKAVNKVENGHDIADLEYFCMGERGDQYRLIGFPNVIPTKYLVNPEKKYDTLDITYFYAGDNEDIQKSQKTITIVMENDNSHTLMNAFIGELNSASGLTIATL